MTVAEETTIVDLSAATDELLASAADSRAGRATRVFRAAPGGQLSQVMMALMAGRDLSEHDNPGEAMLHVLRGRVRMTAGADSWELGAGTHMVIPQHRHSVVALEDAAFLLTVVRGSR